MSTTIEELKAGLPAPIEPDPAPVSAFSSMRAFEGAQRMARLLASSDLVPQQYRGNLANTVIALEMAQRMGASPLAVMQQLYVVHGRPAWSAQFLIGQVNATGRYSSLRYVMDGEGQSRACTAWAVEVATGQRLDGPTVSMAMAKAEGWSSKQGSKWTTMPDLMLRYRAATFWARTYAPELSLGFATAEELLDAPAQQEVVIHPAPEQAPAPAAEPEPPVPGPLWPRAETDEATGDVCWRDSSGELFDPNRHGWSASGQCPSVTDRGVFRARRGGPVATPTATVAQTMVLE